MKEIKIAGKTRKEVLEETVDLFEKGQGCSDNSERLTRIEKLKNLLKK